MKNRKDQKEIRCLAKTFGMYLYIILYYLYCCMIKFDADLQDWKNTHLHLIRLNLVKSCSKVFLEIKENILYYS